MTLAKKGLQQENQEICISSYIFKLEWWKTKLQEAVTLEVGDKMCCHFNYGKSLRGDHLVCFFFVLFCFLLHIFNIGPCKSLQNIITPRKQKHRGNGKYLTTLRLLVKPTDQSHRDQIQYQIKGSWWWQTTKSHWNPPQNPQSRISISKVTYQSNPTLHTEQTVATGRSQLLPTVPQECVVAHETEGDSNALHLRATCTVARAG